MMMFLLKEAEISTSYSAARENNHLMMRVLKVKATKRKKISKAR